MQKEFMLLSLCLLALCSCSTTTVTVGTFKTYEGDSLPESKTALIEGIWGMFGKGVATAICGVDEIRFDPCVIAIELLPGEHTVYVRLILASAVIHRTYVQEFIAGSAYFLRPEKREDGSEEPVIEFRKFRGNKPGIF
jgi:hypothetical protein